jgi:hypothetical protein
VSKSVARTESECGEFVGMKRARFVNESKAAISATIARIHLQIANLIQLNPQTLRA